MFFVAPDLSQTLGVDLAGREVDLWHSTHMSPQKLARPLSQGAVARRTLAFIKAHYPGYGRSGLKQLCDCEFERRLSNGVWDGTLWVLVGLDGRSGDVMRYNVFRNGPVYISTKAKITRKAAEATAVGIYSAMPANPAGTGPP